MRAVFWALGTRGDVIPLLPLARELEVRGVRVTLVVATGQEHHVVRAGLHAFPAGRDQSSLLAGEHAHALGGAPGVVAQLAATARYVRHARRVYERLSRLAFHEGLRDAALHVVTVASVWLAPVLTARGAAHVCGAFLQPATFSSDYPSVLLPASGLTRLLPNRIGHRLADLSIWLPWRGAIARATGLMLPVHGPLSLVHRLRLPVIYGMSPALVPAGLLNRPEHHLTGTWTAASSERPTALPPLLERFLQLHETVVLVSFGSQSRTYARLLRQIVALSDPPYPLVVQTHGVRTGATPGAAGGSGRTLILDGSEGEVEHRAVLNRCRAVVHHGGAGTLHAATRAGVPSVIVPAAADTFFWAAAAEQAGVAPAAVSLAAATGRGVAADMKAASGEPYRTHAAACARRMQGENGLARAAQVLYGHLTG